jgi:hypothetical protein
MIPRVGEGGSSFKGAGLYYLHDKGADTDERVAFTHTLNLHTDDPEKALKVMAWTAEHQNDLKRSAGVPATGRKLEKSVYTYSLSWAPDEVITKEEMIAAAKDSLKALKMDDREVLLVAHTDTGCQHIHAIVNRVHPENGKAASTSRDHLILSRWAEKYEREQGKIRVHARVNHNARRDAGDFVKNRNLTRQEYDWIKAQYRRDPEIIRTERREKQAADQAQLAKRLAQRQSALEGEMARTYGKARGALQKEIKTTDDRIGRPGFFRAVVRKISGAEKRDHTALAQMKTSLGKIDTRMEDRRRDLKEDHAREWEKLERRHAAERMRDEHMIDRARSEGSGGRVGERMRKGFKIRANPATAGFSPAPKAETALSQKQITSARQPEATASEKPKAESGEAKTRAAEMAEEIVRRRRSRPRGRERDREH